MVEIVSLKQSKIMRKKEQKSYNVNNQKEKNLNELVEEFYQLKKSLNDLPKHFNKTNERKAIIQRKEEVLFEIQQQLKKVNKLRADMVRSRLWRDLAVSI